MGVPDVVADGESGFLVEEPDVDAMAERMIQLARDPVLATRLGEVGRERVLAGFSSEITIGRLADVVKRATGCER